MKNVTEARMSYVEHIDSEIRSNFKEACKELKTVDICTSCLTEKFFDINATGITNELFKATRDNPQQAHVILFCELQLAALRLKAVQQLLGITEELYEDGLEQNKITE